MIFESLVNQINSFQEVLELEQIFPKNEVVTGKSPLFVIGPFCSHHPICLNIGRAVFNGNGVVLILVASTEKRYSSFLKKVFALQKICFKVKVLKTFETFIDCERRAILKIPSIFRRTYALSVGFKMKNLRKNVFEC